MNREKLLRRLSQDAVNNVAFGDLRSLVEGFGFRLARVSGNHRIFTHPAIPELVNLQDVRRFLRLIERHNLSLEDAPWPRARSFQMRSTSRSERSAGRQDRLAEGAVVIVENAGEVELHGGTSRDSHRRPSGPETVLGLAALLPTGLPREHVQGATRARAEPELAPCRGLAVRPPGPAAASPTPAPAARSRRARGRVWRGGGGRSAAGCWRAGPPWRCSRRRARDTREAGPARSARRAPAWWR